MVYSESKKRSVRTQFGRKKNKCNPNKNLKNFLKRKEAEEFASGRLCQNVLEKNNHQGLAVPQSVISSNNYFSSIFLQPASTEPALISTSSAASSSAPSTSTGSTPILTASKSTTSTSTNAETINLDNEIQNDNPNTTFILNGTRRIINLEYCNEQVTKI
jgi:hypothetical protein